MEAGEAAAVLARARGGDEDAFASLVQQHSRRLFQLAYRMTGNEHDAEDVVQDTFLRAYRQLRGFQARADFGTWLYRIAANCAVDMMRCKEQRRRRQTDPLEAVLETAPVQRPGPERLAASREIERHIAAALEQLTPLERAAFTLRHHEGRSIAEICRMLNLGTSAAKHSVFRAVKKLRAALEPLKNRGM